MDKAWSPQSWRRFEARQQPSYPDGQVLAAATRELEAYPPLVQLGDAEALQAALGEAQLGRAFLLQGGDCAESFAEFSPGNIQALHALFGAMSDLLGKASGLPIIRLARIAGQFAKPRSFDQEAKSGRDLPAYRGDIVNGIAFDDVARRPDPERMFRAYAQSAATLAHLNALGGDIYTCHEALLLPYEGALVRKDDATGRFYGASAHFLWVGDRTRFLGSAHVEFLCGIANPIGIKCGPSLSPGELLALLDNLNPGRTVGRITLITRMGEDDIEETLPPLIRAVAAERHPVLWACDPMHGNTILSANGYKTRPLDRILGEVRRFFSICVREGVVPGGIHLEMTGRNVTECTGGAAEISEENLADRYHTHCDPRLNPGQALEIAALAGEMLGRRSSRAAA